MGVSNRATTGLPARQTLAKYLPGTMNAQHLVNWLGEQGYIIVPKGHTKPARRGNSKAALLGKVKPVPYTGPDMIGTSHCARLARGS